MSNSEPCSRFADFTPLAFTAASAADLSLPPELAQRTEGKTLLQSRRATGPKLDVRSVYIASPRIEIINIFLYPEPQIAAPLYAMEFVTFGKKPVVAVIDLCALCENNRAIETSKTCLERAHQDFPMLAYAEDPPAWYLECRSGNDFFIRPEKIEDFANLAACHQQVFASLLEELPHAETLSEAETLAHSAALRSYKDHHRENSPGLRFLHQTFGPEWTERLMREVLFV